MGALLTRIHPTFRSVSSPIKRTSANDRTKLLLEGPILSTLLRLSAPNILNLLAFLGVIVFDGFFIGRLGTSALAGASLAFPWVMLLLQTTNSGLGAGVSSAVARAIGADRLDRANELVLHAFWLAIALGAVFSIVMLQAAPILFRWMGGREEMLADALAYADVALGGAIAITVLNLLGNAVRGTGNMTLHASVLIGCVVAHIALSPLLIFGWGPVPALGAAGAGWGLAIPFAVGAIVIIAYLRSSSSSLTLTLRGELHRDLFTDILKVGVPGLLNTGITNLSVVLLTGIAGQFGSATALGYALGARLEYVMQPIAFGLGTTIVAMVGTNWGAQQYRRARQIAWTGTITIAIACGFIGLVVAIYPELWIGMFSQSTEVSQIGALYLHIVGPAYVFFGLGLGLFFVTQGYGKGVAGMAANAARLIASVGAGLVAVYWLGAGMGGFFAAIALSFCLYAALLVAWASRFMTGASPVP